MAADGIMHCTCRKESDKQTDFSDVCNISYQHVGLGRSKKPRTSNPAAADHAEPATDPLQACHQRCTLLIITHSNKL